MTTARCTYTVGRLLAREFRRAIICEGLDFTEDKGWLDVQFVVSGPAVKMIKFHRAAQSWAEQLND